LDVPLWAQYIGQNRFFLIAKIRKKAVFRGAYKNEMIDDSGFREPVSMTSIVKGGKMEM
jgi:hypothetical protein